MPNTMIEKLKDNQQGFTILEVLFAISMLAIGILAVSQMQISFINSTAKANYTTTGTAVAQSMIEQLLTLDNDDPLLFDTNGNGTGQDADVDGDDDDGGNFGLDDVGAAADQVGNNGIYNFSWNIAEDLPVRGAKTINLIVTWNERNVPQTVSYMFIKSNT